MRCKSSALRHFYFFTMSSNSRAPGFQPGYTGAAPVVVTSFGPQALKGCSALLTRRAGSVTLEVHQFLAGGHRARRKVGWASLPSVRSIAASPPDGLSGAGMPHPLWMTITIRYHGLQALKVMRRSCKPQSRERYPGGPPIFSRVAVGGDLRISPLE